MQAGEMTQSQLCTNGNDYDCLVNLVSKAERTSDRDEDSPDIAGALDRHVLLDAPNGDIELMCRKCPVTCTIKSIGGNVIALLHNREACINKT